MSATASPTTTANPASHFRVPTSDLPLPASNPQSQIRNPQSPPRPDLFQDFLNGEVTIEVICADHNLTPEQVLGWLESSQTQNRLDTLAKLDAARAHAIALTNRAEAMATLRRVMFTSKSLSEVRRAASAILRHSAKPLADPAAINPISKSTAPRPGAEAVVPFSSVSTLNPSLAPNPANSHSPSLREGAGGRERRANEAAANHRASAA